MSPDRWQLMCCLVVHRPHILRPPQALVCAAGHLDLLWPMGQRYLRRCNFLSCLLLLGFSFCGSFVVSTKTNRAFLSIAHLVDSGRTLGGSGTSVQEKGGGVPEDGG